MNMTPRQAGQVVTSVGIPAVLGRTPWDGDTYETRGATLRVVITDVIDIYRFTDDRAKLLTWHVRADLTTPEPVLRATLTAALEEVAVGV